MIELIDRVKLIEDFRNTITENSDTFDWLYMIQRQPVVFDKEAVLEKLWHLMIEESSCEGAIWIRKAINIVKEGK